MIKQITLLTLSKRELGVGRDKVQALCWKTWPRHMQRLDASCILGEVWRRETGKCHTEDPRKWNVEQSRQQNWGWMGNGQQGQSRNTRAPLSATTEPDQERNLETLTGASESIAGCQGPEHQTSPMLRSRSLPESPQTSSDTGNQKL